MNESDVVAQLEQLKDVDSLVEALSDEFGWNESPPNFRQAARFLEHHLVNWNDLQGYDEFDLASAIIQAARRTLNVKAIRAAVRVELERKWPAIEKALAVEWAKPVEPIILQP